ncbi:unnamed protein product [Blepharisma stoltei]|uniref:Uncharacterized protein n=1 Tax=Blepharisma stoltei TaxID=1481888 RepID=A0AAU9IXE3_9CILI|nr:unnamed protein product [Blepharisma stoltei]
MTDPSLLSSHSTSPSSSDDDEHKNFKFPSDLVEGKLFRTRSYSSSGSFLDNIPEENEEEIEEYKGRRGSLPGDSLSLRGSPRRKDVFHSLISGEKFLDDISLIDKPKKRFSFGTTEEQVIPEEDLQVSDKDFGTRVSLPVDKKDEPYSVKRRNPFEVQESIVEERVEEDRQIVKHDEFLKVLERYEPEESPHASFVSISAEPINEVEEEEEVLLKHDEFLKKITKQDENFVNQDGMRSSLQETVEEEDEDIKDN